MTLTLAIAFIVAQSIDYALYVQAPYLEANLLPILTRGSMFEIKLLAVVWVVVGAMWLARRGRANARILAMARAVLLVSTGVAVFSIITEVAALTA